MLKPVITLKGYNHYTIQTTSKPYKDPGATATDPVYGNLTPVIATGVENVDLTKPGSYEVTYNVKNKDGDSAETQVRTVYVHDLDSTTTHKISESTGTHTAKVSKNFDTFGTAYVGLANSSQNPLQNLTDITSKVKDSIDKKTDTFRIDSGKINDFVGTDVAPGKQKAIYMSDSSIVGYPGPQLATVRIFYGGNGVDQVDKTFYLKMNTEYKYTNTEAGIMYNVKENDFNDSTKFFLSVYPGKDTHMTVTGAPGTNNLELKLNWYSQNDEPSYYWGSTGTFQIKVYTLYGNNSNWYFPPKGT